MTEQEKERRARFAREMARTEFHENRTVESALRALSETRTRRPPDDNEDY